MDQVLSSSGEPSDRERTGPAPRGAKESEHDEEKKAEKHAPPSGTTVYRAVRREGDIELARSTRELAWSGLAAGLSMGFSLVGEGLLHAHLPETPWRPAVVKLGYSVGFVIVILGRQQLFTEQTLTAILPLLSKDRARGTLANVARLWTVVLAANITGAAMFALVAVWTNAFDPHIRQAFLTIGTEAMAHDPGTILVRGVFGGFLIATLVWLLPVAETARVAVIVIITYIVGLGGFSHIIAGSAEGLFATFSGAKSGAEFLLGYFVPTLVGNVIGGVSLVAALAHAQFAPESSR